MQDNESAQSLPDRRALLAGLGGLAAGTFLAAGRAEAGPLNPPSAPASTPGPEPRIALNAQNTPGDGNSVFKITQPGSYYLAGNVHGVAGMNGIKISASNVTIDLMGFALLGVPTALSGIRTEGEPSHLIIRSGTVSGWGLNGILIATGDDRSAIVEGVIAAFNGASGIAMGTSAIVRGCVAEGNGNIGISCAANALIVDCVAGGNAGHGVVCVANNCIVSNCSATDNGSGGISVSVGSSIANCSAYNNDGHGISTSGPRCLISNCSVASSEFSGIFTSTNCTIIDCLSSSNTTNGIEVSSNCTVRGNTCHSNGTNGDGAGIRVNGVDCRIEGNNCSNSDRGIDVDNTGNMIICNTCSGNLLNYDLVAGNRYGPIINLTAGGTAAVAGSSAADTTNTTHPWANFAH